MTLLYGGGGGFFDEEQTQEGKSKARKSGIISPNREARGNGFFAVIIRIVSSSISASGAIDSQIESQDVIIIPRGGPSKAIPGRPLRDLHKSKIIIYPKSGGMERRRQRRLLLDTVEEIHEFSAQTT